MMSNGFAVAQNGFNIPGTNFQGIVNTVYASFSQPQKFYPEFDRWYFYRFVPGLLDGSRTIVISKVNGAIAGVALLKDTAHEKKICRLEVSETYRGAGMGRGLFEKAFEVLNTSKVAISVPGEKINQFERLLRYYGCSLEEKCQDYYRPNSVEYVFNGILNSKDSGGK